MSKQASNAGMNAVVVVALIGLAGTVIAALLSSPVVLKLLEGSPTETASPSSAGTLVFTEDFEDGVVNGFGFSTQYWQVTKDKSNKVLEMDTTSYDPQDFIVVAAFGPANFRDGLIEFRVKYEVIGGLYTSFRLVEGAEYILILNGLGGIVSLGYNSQEQDWKTSLLSDESLQYVSLQANTWYAMMIEVRGTQFTIYMDGNKLFTGQDSRLQSGRLSFGMDPDTVIMLDDIKVWSFEE